MNRWEILAAVACGLVFSVFAYWRIEGTESEMLRGVSAAFVIGLYGGLVVIGTSDKKRSLSVAWQVLLGVFASLTIAMLWSATTAGYLLAILLGLVLGITAHMWAKHMQLP